MTAMSEKYWLMILMFFKTSHRLQQLHQLCKSHWLCRRLSEFVHVLYCLYFFSVQYRYSRCFYAPSHLKENSATLTYNCAALAGWHFSRAKQLTAPRAQTSTNVQLKRPEKCNNWLVLHTWGSCISLPQPVNGWKHPSASVYSSRVVSSSLLPAIRTLLLPLQSHAEPVVFNSQCIACMQSQRCIYSDCKASNGQMRVG